YQSSSSSGTTETCVPFYEFHRYDELTSRTFRSLEEQVYRKKAALKRQPNQHAAVLIPGEPVQLMKVATLRELPVKDSHCEEFRQACMESAGCYKSPEEAEAEVAALEEQLLMEARSTIAIDSEKSPNVAPTGRKPAVPDKPLWNRTGRKG